MPSKFFRVLCATALSAVTLISSAAGANAVAQTNGIKLYFSAPFVQGPSYTGVDVALETFNSFSTGTGACLGASAVGEITTTCKVDPGNGAGGAATTDDTPTYGGSPSQYARTPWPSGGAEIEILFPEGKQFIGLWWSAGNIENGGGITNFVEFYDGDSLLATMTADRVMDMLGGTVPGPYPGTSTLDAAGGGSYNIGYYYGHPGWHTSLTPTSKSTYTGDNPFVYLNLFTVGATRVDRIVIGGDGFEFDNLATSSLEKTQSDDMVFVEEYLDTVTPPVDEEDNSGGGSDESSILAATGFDSQIALGLGGAAFLAGAVLTVVGRVRRN